MFILKRNVTGYSSPARDYEKRGKVTTFSPHKQICRRFFQTDRSCKVNKIQSWEQFLIYYLQICNFVQEKKTTY